MRLRIYQISATHGLCEACDFVVIAANVKEAKKFIRDLHEIVAEQSEDLKNPKIIACTLLGSVLKSRSRELKAGIQPWTQRNGQKWPRFKEG